MSIERAYPGALAYNVSGATWQNAFEADRQAVYGHADALQTQDEEQGKAALGTTGKGQVGADEITADGPTHTATAPTGFRCMVNGIVYALAAPVEQGFTHDEVNYVFFVEGGTLRVSTVADETTADTLVCTIDDTGVDPVVDMRPTGKRWAGFPRHAMAMAVLDLSGAAQVDVPILHPADDCILLHILLLYVEASSNNTGVAVTVGNETDPDYFYIGDSELSKEQWYELDALLFENDLAGGDTLVCGHPGGKVGTGEILVCAEYILNDAN
jgi:hypothetical protein